MRRTWTLLALSAAVHAAGSTEAPPRLDPAVAITAVAIEHAAGRAEVVVRLSGPFEVEDFVLDTPNRVVLDFPNTKLGLTPETYDRVARGGITNVRVGQPKEGTVRLVVDLDQRRQYTLKREQTGIRVTFDAPASDFSEWRLASDSAAPRSTAPAVQAAAPAARVAPAKEQETRAADLPPLPKSLLSPINAGSTVVQGVAVSAPPKAQMVAAVTPPVVDEPQVQEPRITVQYNNRDLREVIVSIAAAFARRSVVIGEDVQGKVTADYTDVPWSQALKNILDTHGLAMVEEPNGVLRVDSYKNLLVKQSNEPLATRLVPVSYTRAAALAGSIRGLLHKDCPTGGNGSQTAGEPAGSGNSGNNAQPGQTVCFIRGSVEADTSSNTLIVTEVASLLPELLAYVQALDIRTPQVSIKAKIIFVDRTDLQDMGLQYDLGTQSQFNNKLVRRVDPSTLEAIDTNGDGVPDAMGKGTLFDQNSTIIDLGGNALSALVNASQKVATPALDLIFSTALGKFDLTAFLSALQEIRLADVQAEPQITTLDNQEATILVGAETPIRVIQPTAVGNGAVSTSSITFKESGIILRVTPHVTADGQILLKLHSERSSPQVAASDVGFEFAKQSGDSQLLVGNGETAVIAGLTVTEVSVSKVGIPILVDLPIIGRLFGQTRRQDVKRDLLMLVTPFIVDPGQPVRSPGAPGGDR